MIADLIGTNSVSFVLVFLEGISFSFFVLGMSFTTLGSFFNSNKLLLTRIGGILIILLGLFQLGIFDLSFLQKERKIKINLTDKKMNPSLSDTISDKRKAMIIIPDILITSCLLIPNKKMSL